MFNVALGIFGVAAVGGLVLAVQRFRGAPQPSFGLAIVHGLAAATGLVVLLLAVTGAAAPPGTAKLALVLFIGAALGGFFLFAQHLQKKALPIPVVIIHALVAVTAFVILLAGVAKLA